MGAIAAAFQPHILVAPSQKVPFTELKDGHLNGIGFQQAKQIHGYVTGTSRRVPCGCVSAANTYTLTPNPGGPLVVGYFDYETFSFVADVTATGAVLIRVVANGPATIPAALATLPAYKANGATPAGAGDVVLNCQYEATFVDTLNSGGGGFVLR